MSFDYNPFKHIEITRKTKHSPIHLYCHSCGAEWGDWKTTVTAKVLFDSMKQHVENSHQRTEQDFENRSYL